MGSIPIGGAIAGDKMKMTCCFCKKEIDTTKNKIPAQWFGKYRFDKLLEIICLDCIKTKQDKWVERK